ncbi:hypothetical protein [Flavobacterium sp.]|uniref:hypothetical protein n=1 Tax=Flavobacterium sp. TaxID=239 RepID=UPI003752789B
MKKDIFIDNNIASKFTNPQDKEYIKLTKWLLNYEIKDNSKKDDFAHLVVSKKLLGEYLRSSIGAFSDTSIPIIINKLLSEGRLINVTNQKIKDFKQIHYTKSIEKKLLSNNEDREHIPLVLLSERKFALSYDDNFIKDIKIFPKFKVTAEKRPENLPYDL